MDSIFFSNPRPVYKPLFEPLNSERGYALNDDSTLRLININDSATSLRLMII